ncbi:tetracycline resistance protein, tetM/tetO subfamily [Catellatospora sp. TT07R-123]|uniref:elongation factor G n=1 Tax=Catellatospora sp. TT07R-123 TaxID=2733863 RepID=UPI001B22859B|nr:TetM/TetW/TetO/TetS family tetracycline resistance ribosomal protection protein [Catellatospora sp. TT07R-123]GHJ48263.1 tetracycline resistance protein, tetM/tetO subfamily [Catellatospora sp. TT07R-123]
MPSLNLGILAHVDAGKTSLTERLLHAAGVIDDLGSVDEGSTQTDTLALERERGITIKSAVVSFAVGGTTVNLIDTPGHPDFIAEVERVLGVLDGAVLVVSAVEGVQAQTRVLMRVLRRLRIPTLLFVNKIDRGGARYGSLLDELRSRLTPALAPMGTVSGLGGKDAAFHPYPHGVAGLVELLAEQDDDLLGAYLDDRPVPGPRLRDALAGQTGRALVHPVYFGSAMTGAGVDELIGGITGLLPATGGDPAAPVSGTVFKVERGGAGDLVAYLRLYAGTVRLRDRLAFGEGRTGKVTGISVFDRGGAERAPSVDAGRIAKVTGLAEVRIGDTVGAPPPHAADRGQFAPPTLETVVLPRRPGERGALHAALAQLAEQDPLIGLRHDGPGGDLAVSLYGEVQKEVIEATLARDYGIEVAFEQTTTVYIERPVGIGAAAEPMGGANPFRAGVGLRLEPAAPGTGVRFGLGIEPGSLPAAFIRAVEETARRTLRQGLHGWQVTDCVVTLTYSSYTPPPPYGWSRWSSSAGDFRDLTPLVLMAALRQAGTGVHEPVHRVHLEVPADALAAVVPVVGRLGGVTQATTVGGAACELEADLPAVRVHELRRELPSLTQGEGVLVSVFDHYRPVRGAAPGRARTDFNPLDRKEYLLHVSRRA